MRTLSQKKVMCCLRCGVSKKCQLGFKLRSCPEGSAYLIIRHDVDHLPILEQHIAATGVFLEVIEGLLEEVAINNLS